ncbi:hypothetical protein [Novosphingobium terrae]|uniref:hypothetical protein n=1 Tax=Novosphingobium terrae TaxID=2726189 RepID=UPI0019811482|nr:hypothetical protein [Novosphingobium terrae]
MAYLVQTTNHAAFLLNTSQFGVDRNAKKKRPQGNPVGPEGLDVLLQALAGRF